MSKAKLIFSIILILLIVSVNLGLAELRPVITSLSDFNNDGYFTVGEKFIIQGKGFGRSCRVIIGNVQSRIIHSLDAEIIGRVPVGIQTGAHPVTIIKNGQRFGAGQMVTHRYMAATQQGLGEPKYMLHLFDLDKKIILKTYLKSPLEHVDDFAIDNEGKMAFLASRNKLIKLDLSNEKMTKIEFKHNIAKLKYFPGYERLYVIVTQGDQVAEVDSRDFKVKRTLSIKRPGDMAAQFKKGIGLITTLARWSGSTLADQGKFSLIDLKSLEVIKDLKTGKNPVGIKISHDGERIIVCDSNQNSDIFEPYLDTLSILDIDSLTVLKRIYLQQAGMMELSPDGSHVIVARFSDKKITFYPLIEGRATDLKIDYKIRKIDLSNDGKYGYISTRSRPPRLVKVDILRRKVIDEFLIGKYHTPLMVKHTSQGDKAYILSKGWRYRRGWITLMDATSALPFEKIATGHLPGGLDISPDGDRIYVVNEKDNNVSVVDVMEGRVIHEIPLEKGKEEFWPLAVGGVFDRLRLVHKRKLLMVSDYSDRKVFFVNIESKQIIKTITLRYRPAFLDVAPDGNFALVASFQKGNYSILDLNDLSLKKKSQIKGQIRGACFASNSMIALSHYTPKKGYRVTMVSAFDGSKDVIPVDKWVDEIASDSRGEFVYAASSLSGRIYKIGLGERTESSRPVDIIQIGGFPIQLKLDERNDNLILPNYKFNKLGLYRLGDGKMLTEVDFQENIAELVVQP